MTKSIGLADLLHRDEYPTASSNRYSSSFGSLWHGEVYRDVKQSDFFAEQLYLDYGRHEGRFADEPARQLARETFESDWYLAQYPDVRESGGSPLDHYLDHGRQEGRFANRSAWRAAQLAHVIFDSDWYSAQYPDVRESGGDPLEHYLDHGRQEGRFANRPAWRTAQLALMAFDSDWYLAQYPDVRESGGDPLDHYLDSGRHEGRFGTAKSAAYGDTPSALPVEFQTKNSIPPEVLISIPLRSFSRDNLEWLERSRPTVSLVILSYKRPDLVENLIRSIILFTDTYKYEIIVVDNGSPLGTHRLAAAYLPLITLISLKSNRYIGDAYNIGVERSRGKYVVLMNNDIVVQAGWLKHLVDPLAENENVGAVGPKFLYPNGVLQEAGALIDENGFAIQLGKRGDETAEEYNTVREVDYCTGATIAVRRREFLNVYGYSWKWAPGYYEDVDMCFKLRRSGLRILYCPHSVVFHLESITMSNNPPASNMSVVVDINRSRFVESWAQQLRSGFEKQLAIDDHATARVEFALRQDHSPAHSIGIFLPYEFIPGGGEKYAVSLAKSIAKDSQIYLITSDAESILRLTSVLEDLDLSDVEFKSVTLEEAYQIGFDVFITLSNEIIPPIAGFGTANFYICQFPFAATHDELARRHSLKFHDSYDAFIVYSNFVKKHVVERALMWNFAPKIEVLNPAIDLIGYDTKHEKQNWIIGVGRFFTGGHNKRHDKMIEAYASCNRLIEDRDVQRLEETPKEAGSDPGRIKLKLAGAVHAEQRHQEHLKHVRSLATNLDVSFHVNVSRQALNELYRQSKVYWHTGGWGVDVDAHPENVEHFGISIIEAMSAGCVPVVLAVGGPREIVHHGINGILVGSTDEMAQWTVRIIQEWDSKLVVNMRNAALKSSEQFSLDVFGEKAKTRLGLH